MKVSAIIVAAGSSERMNGVDKLEYMIDGSTVLEHSVFRLLDNSMIDEAVVVVRKNKVAEVKRLLGGIDQNKPITVVSGGDTRFLSVQNGVAAAGSDADYYCIHDAARPFVNDSLIKRTIEAAVKYKAAASGTAVRDTIKQLDADGFVLATHFRPSLRAIATPQVFDAKLYRKAAADFSGNDAFDDCELVERFGERVVIIDGEPGNIKITFPQDLSNSRGKENNMRIGQGYDAHRFSSSRELILGGVCVPFELGLSGHSDADVLVHAIIDALLGALALGDIGKLFPDNDPRYKDINSLILLEQTADIIKRKGFVAENIDSTVICEKPKLKEYIDTMRGNIAKAIGIEKACVSVKATTEEGMGFTGGMQGIAAHAVVLLVQRK